MTSLHLNLHAAFLLLKSAHVADRCPKATDRVPKNLKDMPYLSLLILTSVLVQIPLFIFVLLFSTFDFHCMPWQLRQTWASQKRTWRPVLLVVLKKKKLCLRSFRFWSLAVLKKVGRRIACISEGAAWSGDCARWSCATQRSSSRVCQELNGTLVPGTSSQVQKWA